MPHLRFGQRSTPTQVASLPGLNIEATAASYGADVHHAVDTDQVVAMLRAGVDDRDRPTHINLWYEEGQSGAALPTLSPAADSAAATARNVPSTRCRRSRT
jgi:hypothetical protein